MKPTQYVYTFGDRSAQGDASMKVLLGGKGANLAEMCRIGLPVPPGFTITTEACTGFYTYGKERLIQMIKEEVKNGIFFVEKVTGKKFGDPSNPLLLSVRSGARASMPGMMDTVLNLGMNDVVVEGFAQKTGNERAAWDSYRRFIQMYGNVVMDMKPENKEDEDPFERIIDTFKAEKRVKNDTDLSASDLMELSRRFGAVILEKTGMAFPQDPQEQLWGAILAVFNSWMNDRAIHYRLLNDIPDDWGTAVNVQAMVFGNMGDNSATGVAFTRDPATGEDIFIGEYLINAQGEDVVAGIRTPQQITLEGSRRWAKLANISEEERRNKYPSLEETMPELYHELDHYQTQLEDHYADMQDMEFTIEEGKLWILQTRNGKRTGQAMVRIAMEMMESGIIDAKETLLRIQPQKLDELLHPVFELEALGSAVEITRGLPASPGAATGQIVFFADETVQWAKQGKSVILVRMETSPEDIQGMDNAKGILTSRGGMTSHAAVVARGMGKCCISGAGSIHIDYQTRQMTVGDKVYKEGDWISLNGTTGQVFEGQIPTQEVSLSGYFGQLMDLADQYARLEVRTNADTPEEARMARLFGATGIGLCRTEHMFFQEDRIIAVREMILAEDEAGRKKALEKLLPYQREDFEGLFESMNGYPVTIRLLDPPLHEFLPNTAESLQVMAEDLGVSIETVKEKVADLKETNPMLGHRGCRLANTFPEVSAMQVRAILEAALNQKAKGVDVKPEIMVPLTSVGNELKMQAEWIRKTAQEVFTQRGQRIDYKLGTMIEVPRAAVVADRMAVCADFFSFGTNDLTQMTFGFSRDDVGKFLPIYLQKGILKEDPFVSIDQFGVGELVKMAVKKGKATKPNLHVGICGEHGGDPASVEFFHRSGLDYVSCSPYRVPIARLVAAQAAVRELMHIEKVVLDEVDGC
ncbi:MAG TPA: pyruvate, phosphate dikinase [Saprospiraceae bacterium]|nr:pyruvate, phosphate dikinase [Saprospiraceae bacterium]HMQ83704.1 pyruvate, phosphate dikinase [Saprospiraceae bacterium]